MVRALMELGANPREGVYPHRDATSPLTIATERGYDEIVGIIREEEQRLREAKSGIAGARRQKSCSRRLHRAITNGRSC